MNRSLLVVLGAVMLILVMAGGAGASLIGDTVTVAHVYITTSLFGPESTVVAAGDGDVVEVYIDGTHEYDVNVEAYSINTNFAANLEWADPSFNGLVVGSLDDSSGNPLQGVTIDTNMSGWDVSRLSYSNNQVKFNWRDLPFTTETYFNASLDFGQTVPIPGALWLLGSGLLGLAAMRRRRRG